jgi:Kae1-associated kinase Bud32
MHNLDIVHGDLTTLNMIHSNNKIYLIDFGLSNVSSKIEDKAVDLNLFFTCIKNEHPNLYSLKNELLKIYETKSNNSKLILKRLEMIEKRGRNK